MTHSRRAALAVYEFFKRDRKARATARKRPFGFVLSAIAESMAVVDAAVTRSAPATPQSPLSFMAGDWSSSSSLSASQVTCAEEVVEMLLTFGDRTHGVLMRENAIDREIIVRLAHQLNTSGRTFETIVGKVITNREIAEGNINFELSRQTVENRKDAWNKRVAKKLRAEFPDLFGPAEIVRDIRKSGANLVATANELMARGIPAPRGGKIWHARQVSRLLAA